MIKISETDHRFEIKPKESGLGLFAKTNLKAGEYLEVIGVMVDVGEVTNICTSYANDFKVAAEPEYEFQHVIIPIGYSAIINQTNEPSLRNVKLAHLPVDTYPKQNPHSGQTVYIAIRDISAGEEILHYRENKELGAWKKLLAKNIYGLAQLLPSA